MFVDALYLENKTCLFNNTFTRLAWRNNSEELDSISLEFSDMQPNWCNVPVIWVESIASIYCYKNLIILKYCGGFNIPALNIIQLLD